MDKKTEQQLAILWLVKNGFYLYIAGAQSIISLGFPDNIIKYLDVVDENKLQELIASFIEHYKLPQLSIYMIIGSDALIEKDIPLKAENNSIDPEKVIMDSMPFENIYSKIVVENNTKKIIAFNADLYLALNRSFQKFGSNIVCVTPYYVTGQKSFSSDKILAIMNNLTLIKQESIVSNTIFSGDQENNQANNTNPKKPKNYTLVYSLPIFGILLIILTILVIKQMTAPPAAKPTNILLPTITELSPTLNTIPASPSASASLSAVLKDKLKIKIYVSPDQKDKINLVKQELIKSGYLHIEINDNNSTNSSKNFILVKSSIPNLTRDELTKIVSNFYPLISVQENNTIVEDIAISIIKTQ